MLPAAGVLAEQVVHRAARVALQAGRVAELAVVMRPAGTAAGTAAGMVVGRKLLSQTLRNQS